jgi:hypothetical protein
MSARGGLRIANLCHRPTKTRHMDVLLKTASICEGRHRHFGGTNVGHLAKNGSGIRQRPAAATF